MTMIHSLCKKCIQKCKQENTVNIVHCPRFQKRLSDNEFRDIIDELKALETEADELKSRSHGLIHKALSKEDNVISGGINNSGNSTG